MASYMLCSLWMISNVIYRIIITQLIYNFYNYRFGFYCEFLTSIWWKYKTIIEK